MSAVKKTLAVPDVPPLPNLSLVAAPFRDNAAPSKQKSDAQLTPDKIHLRAVIRECQDRMTNLGEKLKTRFDPSGFETLHGTIIGLERLESPGYRNFNFMHRRQEQKEMEIPKFLDALITGKVGRFPVRIQIGAFSPLTDYFLTDGGKLLSNGQIPFIRSFSVQSTNRFNFAKPKGEKLSAGVVMGWPFKVGVDRCYLMDLEDLRYAAQDFGILHSWHHLKERKDNDFFFRIGTFENEDLHKTLEARNVEADLRNYLSTIDPINLEVPLEDLWLVTYDDNTFRTTTTRWQRLLDRVPGTALFDLP